MIHKNYSDIPPRYNSCLHKTEDSLVDKCPKSLDIAGTGREGCFLSFGRKICWSVSREENEAGEGFGGPGAAEGAGEDQPGERRLREDLLVLHNSLTRGGARPGSGSAPREQETTASSFARGA